jgi:hypothetical protein
VFRRESRRDTPATVPKAASSCEVFLLDRSQRRLDPDTEMSGVRCRLRCARHGGWAFRTRCRTPEDHFDSSQCWLARISGFSLCRHFSFSAPATRGGARLSRRLIATEALPSHSFRIDSLAVGRARTDRLYGRRTQELTSSGLTPFCRTATSREQWYVSISRGRKRVVVLTPDRTALRENIQRTSSRELALEEMRERSRFEQENEAWRMRRRQSREFAIRHEWTTRQQEHQGIPQRV